MGWRYRKSIKILPGVRLNLNKKSRSVSIGGKAFHTTFSSTGRVTNSASIPGTGLYHTSTVRKGKQQPTKQTVQHSPKTYKVSGVILLVISVLLFAMSLAIISFSSVGFVFALLAVLLFFVGLKYRKFGKEPELDEQAGEFVNIGLWDIPADEYHNTAARYKRGLQIDPECVEEIDREQGSARIMGSEGSAYNVTLDGCECSDFQKRGLPCKHMLRLAHELGEEITLQGFDQGAEQ